MKRLFSTILSLSLIAGGLGLLSETDFSRAQAEEQGVKAELFLPNAYEQYLPLDSPTDIAIGDNHIAISDGKTIYVYSKTTGEYTAYTHGDYVNELQFSGDKLYFLDQGMNLFTVNANALPTEAVKPTEKIQSCISFVISSDVMYFTKKSGGEAQIYSAYLSNPADEKAHGEKFTATTDPAIAVEDGELYYTHESLTSHLYRLSSGTDWEVRLPDKTIDSIALSDGVLYYAAAGNFYSYDLTALQQETDPSPLFKAEGADGAKYSAVTAADDGFVYAVCGASVKRYDPDALKFTSYEISSSSSAENRLSDAKDFLLLEDKLITADYGNARLSVTDRNSMTSYTVPTIAGNMLASDGTTALVASRETAALYDLTNGQELASFPSFASPIVGVTNVYGTYYFATESGFGKIDEEYNLSAVLLLQKTPRHLTSDIYGDLYVAFEGGSVFRYTEEEFLDPDTQKTAEDKLATLPTATTKLLVDFDRNLYALKDGNLYTYKENGETVRSLSKALVYSQTAETEVVSVCFGAEDNAAYILYDGNFIVRTNELDLPTVRDIPVAGADESVFGETNLFSLVKISGGTLFIHFDIERLNGAENFPYLSYEREQEEAIALKLGEAGRFNVVAVFDEVTRKYTTALVEKASCPEEIAESGYLKPAEKFTDDPTGYITNALPLYKYPYLTDLLVSVEIPKNAEVTVLGQIDELDYKYYQIRYTDSTGKEFVGYLPQKYVSEFDGRYPESEQITVGENTTDLDSVWRATFILLGCAAIAILTDFLILRKKK